MIRASPTLAKVLVGLFCARPSLVLAPSERVRKKYALAFQAVAPNSLLRAVAAAIGSLPGDVDDHVGHFY